MWFATRVRCEDRGERQGTARITHEQPARIAAQPPQPFQPEALEQRRKVIRQRNVVMGLVLAFFAVLFFAITIAKMKM